MMSAGKLYILFIRNEKVGCSIHLSGTIRNNDLAQFSPHGGSGLCCFWTSYLRYAASGTGFCTVQLLGTALPVTQ